MKLHHIHNWPIKGSFRDGTTVEIWASSTSEPPNHPGEGIGKGNTLWARYRGPSHRLWSDWLQISQEKMKSWGPSIKDVFDRIESQSDLLAITGRKVKPLWNA